MKQERRAGERDLIHLEESSVSKTGTCHSQGLPEMIRYGQDQRTFNRNVFKTDPFFRDP